MGSSGFRLAGDLLYWPGEVILEVGADRDEGSTPWLAGLGAPVVVIDVDQEACWRVGRPGVVAVCGLAEDVLMEWGQPASHTGRVYGFATLPGWGWPIRFAWLDGHDWPYEGPEYPPGCWDEQKAQYLARGQEYSQAASQDSHFRIAELIAGSVTLGGVVAFDDTWPVGDAWDGKGGTAVPYLLSRGFQVLRAADQLVALERPA